MKLARIRSGCLVAMAFCLASAGFAETFCNQLPPTGGGTRRSSQWWVDPSGQGNDLDGDSACYADFVLAQPSEINRIEWWGDSLPNKGFQLEVWPQDPGTIAYQPYAVFRRSGARPTWKLKLTTVSSGYDASGTTHYWVDLATPITLGANGTSNVRWFFAVIGLTDVPFLQWNWAQGVGGSLRSYQWIRGGYGGGDLFRSLPEGRALLLAGATTTRPISGQLTFLDWLPTGGTADITVTPVNGGTPTVDTVTTQPDGSFAFQTSLTGDVWISAKASHWLCQRLGSPITIGTSGVSNLAFSLVNGDIDGDNEVGPGDFGELSAAFGSVDGDANWNLQADLDGDQEVGPSDFGILSSNFGESGT